MRSKRPTIFLYRSRTVYSDEVKRTPGYILKSWEYSTRRLVVPIVTQMRSKRPQVTYTEFWEHPRLSIPIYFNHLEPRSFLVAMTTFLFCKISAHDHTEWQKTKPKFLDFIPAEAWQGDIPASFCNGELLSYTERHFKCYLKGHHI